MRQGAYNFLRASQKVTSVIARSQSERNSAPRV